MARPILPFSISNEEPKTPLSPPPYNDRVVFHQLDPFDVAKNYKYVAFRPGYPLQAAELNEIQTYYYYEQTLFAFMVNAWGAFSGAPFEGSGDEGTDIRYAGPGWDGTTPVSPYNNIQYAELAVSATGVSVLDPISFPALFNDIPDLVEATDNVDSIRVKFKPGHYFAKIKTGTEVDNGFKYMVALNDGLDDLYTLDIPKEETGKVFVGFTMSQKYIQPTTVADQDENGDSTLNDNSSGFYNDVAAGAARVRIQFNQIAAYGDGAVALFPASAVSPVLYIDHDLNEVRYMNGVPVYVSDSLTGGGAFGRYS